MYKNYKPYTFFTLLPFRYLILLSLLALVSSLTPFISFWGLSKVVDTVSGTVQGAEVFIYIIMIGAFLVTNDTFEAIRWTYSTYLEGKIFLELKGKLLTKIASSPYIDIFENPQFLNRLSLADQSIPRFHGFFNSLAMLASGILGSIPFLWIGFTTRWWVPAALIAAFLPSLIIKWNLEERLWALEIQNGEEYKEASVQESMLLSPAFAKEIRLWDAAFLLLNRWKKNRMHLLQQTASLRNKSMLSTLFANIFEGLADCAVIAYLYTLLMQKELSAGNFVFAITAVTQLRQNAFTVLLFGLDINIAFKRLKPFFEILNMEDKKVLFQKKPLDSQHKSSAYISLKNICFTYPGCDTTVLKNINCDIQKKEKIAVVGANGSGKTTLVKLISGMYPILEGSYIFNGTDTNEIPPCGLRKSFSAVYQDFAQFPMTFKENVCISCPDSLENSNMDEERFNNICKRFPAFDSSVTPSSLLTRQFEGGIDLSGGQWQRLALIRCAWADREVVLLDEPTAALDPESEHEVLDAMLDIIKEKTAIIVTHRLALCRKVDRIIVMDNGKIIEAGTHTELIQKNGKYAQMYKKQGGYYGAV